MQARHSYVWFLLLEKRFLRILSSNVSKCVASVMHSALALGNPRITFCEKIKMVAHSESSYVESADINVETEPESPAEDKEDDD